MGKGKTRREWDLVQVFGRVPDILGMEMRLRGAAWEGRHYINGDRHPYRRDKLKVKIYNGDIWVHEQGGESLSLAAWLVNYGGCADFKSAYATIRSFESGSPDFTRKWMGGVRQEAEKVLYVEPSEYAAYARYPLWECPLYRWMCGVFGQERVAAAWKLYGVTTDERGLAVWWFVDADGDICHDKRMRYRDDGHRDKTFGGTRKYRTGDGYTARSLFGAHLIGREMPSEGVFGRYDGVSGPLQWESMPNVSKSLGKRKINVVESEKTALMCHIAFGGLWVATGGKGNLRESDPGLALWPDVDAASGWSERGDVCEWWLDAEESGAEVGENWDMGDFVEWILKQHKT